MGSFILQMPRSKDLSLPAREALRDFLIKRSENGKLKWGAVSEAAELFGVNKSSISRLWRGWQARRDPALNENFDVSSGKAKNGRPFKYPRPLLQQEVRSIPLRERSTCRSAADRLGLSVGTLHRMLRSEKVLKSHTSRMKGRKPIFWRKVS